MAKIIEWSEDQRTVWNEWVATRPPIVQELCRQFPPDRLYKLKSSGNRVTLYSFSEDGTVTVNITGEYNAIMFDRRVFGVKPDDLIECNLPEPNESIGTVLTEENDVNAFIEIIRPSILSERNLL